MPTVGKIKLMSILLIFIILIIYYHIGAENFPDYDNYLSIAGGQVNESKVFEWIPKLWFKKIYEFTNSSNLAVDSFVILIHTLIVAIILNAKYRAERETLFWILVLFGALYMTTTIRAALPCILSLYIYIYRSEKLWLCLAILAVMLSFHDSSILILGIWITYRVMNLLLKIDARTNKMAICLMVLISVISLYWSIQNIELFMMNLNYSTSLEYLKTNDVEVGLLKNIYIILNLICAVFVILKYGKNLYVLLMSIVTAAVFSVAPVAGIRVSQYLTIILIYELIKNSSYSKINWNFINNSILILFASIIFAVNLLEVLRHANV